MLLPVSWLALATAAAPKTCYWFEGYDARGVNNTSWDGPVRTPLSPTPLSSSSRWPLADRCGLGAGGERLHERAEVGQALHEGGLLRQVPGARLQRPHHRTPPPDPTPPSPTPLRCLTLCLCWQGKPCAFSIWNPTASSCFYKTAGAVAFAKTGDTTCCPEGSPNCPSSPPGGPWKLLHEFSDEFPACTQPWSKCAAPNIAPLNLAKWNTSVASWGDWSWDPANVKVIAQLPAEDAVRPTSDAVAAKAAAEAGEIPDYSGYAALTMSYEKHVRDGKTYFYKAGIMKSTVPAGVTYGRFEARIKGASRWPGVCPAFWAWRGTGEHWTELDFVEMQENAGSVRDIDFTSHVFPPTPGVKTELSNGTHKLFDFDPRDDFHVYAMEWNATMLTWWVDDVVVKEQPAAPYFNRGWAMDVALSFGLRPPLNRQDGGAPNATGFPTTFYVDWVRTWQRV